MIARYSCAERVGEGSHQLVVGGVVLVAEAHLNAGRSYHRHERFQRGVVPQRVLQVGYVALHRLRLVAQRARDDGLSNYRAEEVRVLHVPEDAGVGVSPRVEAGELIAVAALQERLGVLGPFPPLDAVHPVADVPHPQGLAELAVVYDVDPGPLLAGDNLGDRRAQFGEHVRRPLPAFRHGLRQFSRPLERPNVGGKDPVSAPLHSPSLAPLPRAPQ